MKTATWQVRYAPDCFVQIYIIVVVIFENVHVAFVAFRTVNLSCREDDTQNVLS